jgi:coenzyme F420 hydrogenase subunit beta
MNVFGPAELMDDIIKTGLCIGCGACVNLCPYFRSHLGQTAQLFACTVEQGRCHAACPKAEVDLAELARHNGQAPYQGAPIFANIVMIGALAGARVLPFGRTDFETVVARSLPADRLAVNLAAFDAGQKMVNGAGG